jgi:hypothetical protein
VAGYRVASGRGRIVAITRNDQAWLPAIPPPYFIAIIALAEDPNIRLTSNLVGPGSDALDVGMAVRVHFEPFEDIWLPFFEIDPGGEVTPHVQLEAPMLPPMPAPRPFRPEDRVVISGIGASAMGRRLPQSGLALTIDACRAAMSYAGRY